MSMTFWTRHSEEMRKARLLAASAILLAQKYTFPQDAVEFAFRLEKQINEKITKEKE
jgi:hypothetical protein